MPGKMARSDPRPSIRTRGAGSGQHLASVLQEGRENANIDAGLGFIWGISDQKLARTHRQSVALAATLATRCGSRHPRSSTSAHPRTASCRSADQKKRPRRGVPRPRSHSRVTRRPSGAREAACCRSASLTKKWTKLITLATASPPASRDGFLQLVVSAEARWNAALRVRVPLRYRQTEQKCA